MVIMTQKQTKPREKNDFYPTPFDLAYAIVSNFVDVMDIDSVIDPGYGDGVFGYAIRRKVLDVGAFLDDENEIVVDGVDNVLRDIKYPGFVYSNVYIQDYLKYKEPFKYNLAIGNPPYSLAEEFVRKSLDITEKNGMVVFLLKLAFLEGSGRCRGLFKEFPPTEVSVLANRASFDGTGKTNDYAFAVFVWDKVYMMKPYETYLTWFDWKKK